MARLGMYDVVGIVRHAFILMLAKEFVSSSVGKRTSELFFDNLTFSMTLLQFHGYVDLCVCAYVLVYTS